MILSFAILLAAVQSGAIATESHAPDFAWYAQGGCAARSASSSCNALRGRIVEAWVHEEEHRIVGEPLVWGDLIVLELDAGASGRILRFLDLRTGLQRLNDRKFPTTSELYPSLWGRDLLLRTEPDLLQVFRVRSRGTVPVWRKKFEEELGPSLLVDGQVFAVTRSAITSIRVGRAEPDWVREGIILSPASVREDQVFVMIGASEVLGRVKPHVTILNRSDGIAGSLGIIDGWLRLKDAGWSSLQIFRHSVAATFEPGIRYAAGELTRHCLWSPAQENPQILQVLEYSPALRSAPVECLGGWVGPVGLSEGGIALAHTFYEKDAGFEILASPKRSPDFAVDGAYLTRVRDAVYVGARAFDLMTGRVLWRLPYEPSARLVPVRRTLLVVDRGQRLIALREAFDALDQRASAPEAWTAPQARCSFRDGTVSEGDWSLDPETGTISAAGSNESWPWDELCLVESTDGTLLEVHDLDVGLNTLVDHEWAEIMLDALANATRAGEPALLEAVLRFLALSGAEGRAIDEAAKTLERWAKRPPKLNALHLERLREATLRAETAVHQVPAHRLAQLDADAPVAWRHGLLRAVLEVEPDDAEAAARVLASLPEEFREGLSFGAASAPALEWLDLVEVTQRIPLSAWSTEEIEAGEGALAERLRAIRAKWRPDLIALQSGNLLILTPLHRPGAIARCLRLGETVCAALEELFPPVEQSATGAEAGMPMIVQLFESREEYLSVCAGDERETRQDLDWTAGHYSPVEGVSRVYMPDEFEDGFGALLEILAHELTHHWLEARCTRFTLAAVLHRERVRGYWVVEGVASLVEEFRFRPDLGLWDPFHPQSPGLDHSASAHTTALIPWDMLLEWNHLQFEKVGGLMPQEGLSMPTNCRLGEPRTGSGREIYYLQAAALARFLAFADDGAHRELLLALVDDHYSGRTVSEARTRIEQWGKEDLGERIAAYAHQVLNF